MARSGTLFLMAGMVKFMIGNRLLRCLHAGDSFPDMVRASGLYWKAISTLAVFLMFAPFASAQDQKTAERTPYPEQSIRDCDCRAAGRFWRQGQHVCLGGRRFVCGMDLNVSSWIATGDDCPQARATANPANPSPRRS
jgi:hypothetical protein